VIIRLILPDTISATYTYDAANQLVTARANDDGVT
jgi:YD repeat-containing protein